MRKALNVLGVGAVAAAGVFAFGGTAQAAPASASAECTLVQSEVTAGAGFVEWAQGLRGCSGDVYWEIRSRAADGSWSVWTSGTTHYDDGTVRHTGDADLPCTLSVYARFAGQEVLTGAAVNEYCGACG